MERVFHETTLNGDGNIVTVSHPDPYTNAQYLALSGQGLIFIAFDGEQKRHVAIKKTKYDLCNFRQSAEQHAKYELAKNVYREFELGILVNHKNIMNILDAYTPDPTFQEFRNIYLVFELMNQRDLRHLHFMKWNEICDYQKGAPLVADLMLQLFSAIAYLHQDKLRLIHRDIKPDNILIQQIHEFNYLIKLGDLGHARKIPPSEGPQMTEGLTTCQYRAPEIMQKEPYSTPADIWSAGCVLAEILIPINPSKPLFDSNDPQIVSKMHCEITSKTISTKFANNKLPQWRDIEKWGEYFRAILENTLKLNPNERVKAVGIIKFNPFEMLDLKKYEFEEVSEIYEEKAEDPRKPVDWRMKIYDKLKTFNKKRMEESLKHQNDGNFDNF